MNLGFQTAALGCHLKVCCASLEKYHQTRFPCLECKNACLLLLQATSRVTIAKREGVKYLWGKNIFSKKTKKPHQNKMKEKNPTVVQQHYKKNDFLFCMHFQFEITPKILQKYIKTKYAIWF